MEDTKLTETRDRIRELAMTRALSIFLADFPSDADPFDVLARVADGQLNNPNGDEDDFDISVWYPFAEDDPEDLSDNIDTEFRVIFSSYREAAKLLYNLWEDDTLTEEQLDGIFGTSI